MAKNKNKELSLKDRTELPSALKARFENNMLRHEGIEWHKIQAKLESNSEKLRSINKNE